MEVDDYEVFVTRAKQRFRIKLISIVVGLILSIHLPWALVPGRLKSGTAVTCTLIAGVLLLGAWRALMTKVADPDDAPQATAESRKVHLYMLHTVAGGMLGLNFAFGCLFYLAGLYETEGIGATMGFSVVMAFMVARAFVVHQIRAAL